MILLAFLFVFKVFPERSPVLLVGGLFGSQLEYYNISLPIPIWGVLWLDIIRTILDPSLYINEVRVNYDSATNVYSNNVLATQVKRWNSTAGLDHADDLFPETTFYYRRVINALEDAGYKDGVDLWGAPFDFRLESFQSVLDDEGLFSKLKELIESIYKQTGKPIYIVTHSESALVIRYFFAKYVSSEWKSTFITGWISGAGTFGGAPAAFHHVISNLWWMVPTLNGDEILAGTGYFAGLYWSLPNPVVFSKDYLLAQVTTDTTSFNITMENITTAFSRGVGENQANAAKAFQTFLRDFSAPDVDLWYYHGSGVDTLKTLAYTGTDSGSSGWWLQAEDAVETDTEGDGLMPMESLTSPELWKATSRSVIEGIDLPGCTDVLNSDDYINAIVSRATGQSWDSDPARPLMERKRQIARKFIDHAKRLEENVKGLFVVMKEKVRAEMRKRNNHLLPQERKEEIERVGEEEFAVIAAELLRFADIHTAEAKSFTSAAAAAAAQMQADAQVKFKQPQANVQQEQQQQQLERELERRAKATVARLDAQHAVVVQAVEKTTETLVTLVKKE